MTTLSNIAAEINDPKAKSDAYLGFLEEAVKGQNVSSLMEFVEHLISMLAVLSDSVALVLSRQLLSHLVTAIQKLDSEAQKTVGTYALEKLAPRTVSYEEQSAALREQLASVYQSQEEWIKAAQTLAGIDLESGMRVIDPEYKLGMYVRIAMLYLEEEDVVGAETFIKRASSLLSSCTNEELELQYKGCYARLLDSKRRFLEAATRYFELSQVGHKVIGGRRIEEEDVMKALSAAITCAILASAGPQRSRMLATLYKDERTSKLPALRPFLEKVYMERILKAEEVDKFAQSLAPHQLARLGDGSTVLERSVMEHNLEAASKLYSRIYISELAALLGISDCNKIEKAAGKMISESRLKGTLDQVDGLLTFGQDPNPLEVKDHEIENLCRTADSALNNAIARGLALS